MKACFLLLTTLVAVYSLQFGAKRVRSPGVVSSEGETLRAKANSEVLLERFLGDEYSPRRRKVDQGKGNVNEKNSGKSNLGRNAYPPLGLANQPLIDPPGPPRPLIDPTSSPGIDPKPKITYRTEDYSLYDNIRRRYLSFFDPEYYVRTYPYYPFPYELDIPFGWVIYNPVTVQAPRPHSEPLSKNTRFSGYYYACPKWVNPFDYSWFFKNEEINQCKWNWYQTREDETFQ